jgi:hypothetical protein
VLQLVLPSGEQAPTDQQIVPFSMVLAQEEQKIKDRKSTSTKGKSQDKSQEAKSSLKSDFVLSDKSKDSVSKNGANEFIPGADFVIEGDEPASEVPSTLARKRPFSHIFTQPDPEDSSISIIW